MIKKSLVCLSLVYCFSSAQADLIIYTDRSADFMDPVVESFEAQTGQNADYITLDASDIIDRLLAEGAQTPADVIIAKDLLYLNEMSNLGLFQPMAVSTDHIPVQMQNPDKLWAAITMRARTIVYNKDKVNPEDIQTYQSLGEEQWRGRLCLRTSNSSYNVSLIAGLVADLGYDGASSLVSSWVNNLAQEPLGGDRSVLEAIENEACDVGVVNSYYLGQENADGNNLNVGVVFANQNGQGVHVNGTGGGVVSMSSNPELANEFMDVLLSSESQYVFSNAYFDYPVSPGLTPETLVAEWGTFYANETNWSVIGNRVEEAKRIIVETDYR